MSGKIGKTPELRQIVGSLILGTDRPLSDAEICGIINTVEKERVEAEATDSNPAAPENGFKCSRESVREIVAELIKSFREMDAGVELVETAVGYRFQTSASCGPWVRRMLNREKPAKLAKSAVETLAIIAYRQPVTRSEIESIRGVGVTYALKVLMETELVRVVGRSNLPGNPYLFGTTNVFLEHFGLKNLDELDKMR